MIKNPNDIVEQLIADYIKAFGDSLISAIMYGSAASHEFRPGKSDINVALVLKDNSIKALSQSVPIQKKWFLKGVSIPMFMTKHYIESSLDTFPIEFLDIQTCYRILYGEDLIGNLQIERSNLRLQCERELKGIALRLRTAYASCAGSDIEQKQLLDAAMKRLLPLFKAILVLYDRKIPHAKGEIIAAVEDTFDLGSSVYSEVFYHNRKNKNNYTEIFDRFTQSVDAMIQSIDSLEVSE